MRGLLLLSVNNSWNILNFRAGLVRALQGAGFSIAVMSPPDAHAPRLAELGIEHIPVAIDSKGVSPIRDFRLLLRYYVVLRQRQPAAYLSWTIKPNVYGSIAAHILRIPVFNNVSGLGTAFIRRGPLTTIVSLLYRLAFRRSATVFFQNTDDRALFVDNRLVTEERTALLPGSGIDTVRFAPTYSSDKCERPFTFLLIARLLRDKGVVEYVDAARRLKRHRRNLQFKILGMLDSENRTAIGRKQLAAWVEEGAVVHIGDTDDVRPAIAGADCVVLPSYREGLPRALLEGAALGKPLIATRVPGCVEIAREGINAFLCAPRDPASLAEAMRRMIDLSDNDRYAMGAAGRNIVVAEFGENIVFERYLDALNRATTAHSIMPD